MRELFQIARRNAPCVLFLDEVDALGQKRSQLRHSAARGTVNQLLAEMDGISSVEGVYVLGATNHSWDVDVALRRPGRFDRMLLVLPPDEPAHEAILRYPSAIARLRASTPPAWPSSPTGARAPTWRTSARPQPRAWCLMARARLGLKHYAEAVQAANAAVALAPDYEWPHRLASLALEEQGNHPEAARAAREAVRVAPHTWQAHVRLAHAGIQAWGMDEARVAAERALALAPGVADTHIAAGAVAAAAGDRGAAEAHFRRALAIEPDSAVAHNELARLHLRHAANPVGLARAATGFATAVRSDPRASVSRHNLDVVVRVFLGRPAYGVWFGTYLVVRLDCPWAC